MSEVRHIHGDARSLPLADGSVQCVVTSPPYHGLRKYAGEQESVWPDPRAEVERQHTHDPDEACDVCEFEAMKGDCEHDWVGAGRSRHKPDRSTCGKDGNGSGVFVSDQPRGSQPAKAARGEVLEFGGTCRKCGAWRGGFGLEPNIEMYVAHTVEILREIRRVLRDDGVVFWNIGDSFASGKGTCFNPGGGASSLEGHGSLKDAEAYPLDRGNKSDLDRQGLKPKDLCGIPFRVAQAAQADGWWWRQMIIWSKPNPMPESTTDRPTTSHEYILLLTKSGDSTFWMHRAGMGTRTQPKPDYRWFDRVEKIETATEPDGDWRGLKLDDGSKRWRRFNLWRGHDYFWDADAVREPITASSFARISEPGFAEQTGGPKDYAKTGVNRHRSARKALEGFAANAHNGRNMRSVWEIPTQPFPEAHFATFPEEIARRCIKAGTSERGACSECGAPWVRQVEASGGTIGKTMGEHANDLAGRDLENGKRFTAEAKSMEGYSRETVGWRPSCECLCDGCKNEPKIAEKLINRPVPIPCVVLDPFAGSGTVGKVAIELNRRAILVDGAYDPELGEDGYLPMAQRRCSNVQRNLVEA